MRTVGELIGNKVIVADAAKANSLHSKGSIGTLRKNTLELSLVEAYYLIEKGKIEVLKNTDKQFLKKANKSDKRFNFRYAVYKDLRMNGFVVKTALKYGFDYRVYDKGVKLGEAHAKWLVVCYGENEKFNWKDYSKIMRLTHSVRKTALIGVVDDEGDVTYYESNWKKL